MLLDIFLHAEKEGFANIGAIALSHVVKVNPSLFNMVIDTIPIPQMCQIMLEKEQRVQQAFITMMNIALLNKNQNLLDQMEENSE